MRPVLVCAVLAALLALGVSARMVDDTRPKRVDPRPPPSAAEHEAPPSPPEQQPPAADSEPPADEAVEDDFAHEQTARKADPRHQYAQVDEMDTEQLEELGTDGDAGDRADELAAEVRQRCFGQPSSDDQTFCGEQAELVKAERDDQAAVSAAMVALILREAHGTLDEAAKKRMKEVHDDYLSHPSPTSPEKLREIEDEMKGTLNERQDVQAPGEGPAPLVASNEPAPTAEQVSGEPPAERRHEEVHSSATGATLVELAERIRRHMTAAGLEASNPKETSPTKLWPNPVPYAFWNPPDDRQYGLLEGVPVNYGWWRAKEFFRPKGKIVAKTNQKAYPYYGLLKMLAPSEMTLIKKVTTSIVQSFRAAVKHLEDLTCLKFKEVAADADMDKILIVRDGSSDTGAASYGIGRTVDRYTLPHGGKHGLHLIVVGKDDSGIGGLVHEILHALGLGHTQQRADSKTYLKHFPNNMDKDWKPQYTPDDQPADWFVTPVDAQAFDFGSVMSYPAWSSAMADATALANAASTDKNAKGEIRMLESLVPADSKRRALNEDFDSGGLGQCIAAKQGRMSYVDAEIINDHYKCTAKLLKLPANAQIVPEDAKAKGELKKAKPLCECPTDKYASRVSKKKDCLKEPSDWASDMAEVIRTSMPETKRAALDKFPVAHAKLKKKSAKKKAKLLKQVAEKERNSIVKYLGESLSQFVGDCRKYCSTRPEYKTATCWVNAIKFVGPLAIDPSDTGVPSVPWKFQCGRLVFWKNYGCFL